jgi:hypothetical protein
MSAVISRETECFLTGEDTGLGQDVELGLEVVGSLGLGGVLEEDQR